MNLFRRIFGKAARPESPSLPCSTGACPYEYSGTSDRDVEGMPFAENDPRSCPQYGHICPEFMEDFGLTVEDLNIRATVHCGSLIKHLISEGKADPEAEPTLRLLGRLAEVIRCYPPDRFPHYYAPTLNRPNPTLQ